MSDADFPRDELIHKRGYLLAQREAFAKLDAEHWKSYDQAILTLSSAILGVSVAFVNQVPRPISAPLALYLAWSALVLSVVTTLISFRVASFDAHWHIFQVDQELAKLLQVSDGRKPENPHATPLKILNNLSGGFFALGLILLVAFAISNLKPSEVRVKDSQTVSIPNVVDRGTPAVAPAQFPVVTPATTPASTPTTQPVTPAPAPSPTTSK
jgi:hypothetical protein